jgi:hypothetical protein
LGTEGDGRGYGIRSPRDVKQDTADPREPSDLTKRTRYFDLYGMRGIRVPCPSPRLRPSRRFTFVRCAKVARTEKEHGRGRSI